MRLSLRPPRFLSAALHPDIPSDPALCPNCGSRFAEPRPKFCGECGQESRLRPPTLGEFGQQLGGAYISMEGALWRTLWRLFLLPGQLTLEYFAGRRRRYVLPLRLYLTVSVIAFLVLRLVTVPHLEAQADASGQRVEVQAQATLQVDEEDTQNIRIGGIGGYGFGLTKGKFYCHQLPESMCKRLEKRITGGRAHLKQELLNVTMRSLGNLGATMFVLLPAFALWLKLIFVDKRRYYTEHLVFALHLHAFWFAMLVLMLVPVEGVQAAAWLASMIYPLIAIQRVYRTRWWSTALRAALLAMLNLCVTGLTVALLFLATMVS